MALSDTAVRAAKPRETNYTLADSEGLSLFVTTTGSKTWHFRFRLAGKQTRFSLGAYPGVTLKGARAKRDAAMDKIARGVDPRRPEAQAPDVLILRTVAEQWYAFKAVRLTTGRQGAAAQLRRYLDKDILPQLGDTPIADIKRADVIAVVHQIEVRGALNVAEKVRTWLKQVFRFAVVHGYIEANPASDLDAVAALPPPVQHNPVLLQAELGDFVLRTRAYRGSLAARAGIQLLLLTGVRTAELRNATPEQFDMEAGIWRVPADGVKQLRKRVRTEGADVPDYLVPLSRQAMEIVRELKHRYGGSPYLLPGRNGPGTMVSENTLNVGIKKMGYKNRLTGHGLRGTMSTALYEAGYATAWVEAQLSHADPHAVRGSYNHAKYVEQRRGMMQAWADTLDELADQAELAAILS